jgi:C-terminal processing protease CtpA/Prc
MIISFIMGIIIGLPLWCHAFTIRPISDAMVIHVPTFDAPIITKKTQKKITSPQKKVIIDLRNNPGGNLHDAISFGALFVTKNQLISIQSRQNAPISVTRPDAHPIIIAEQLIILINHRTASAAEAAAHVLSHHQNSIRIGTTTYGKTAISTPKNNFYKALLMEPVTPNITWEFTENDLETDWLKAISLAHEQQF